jgi:hypothetical protein
MAYPSFVENGDPTIARIRRPHLIPSPTFGYSSVAFLEDLSRIRTKPGHFARLRSFALNVPRPNGTTNVARELYINTLTPDNALSYPLG